LTPAEGSKPGFQVDYPKQVAFANDLATIIFRVIASQNIESGHGEY